MKFGLWMALITLTTAMQASSQPDAASKVKPGEVEVFKDWVVGCDNLLWCEAIGLIPEAQALGKRPEDLPYTSISVSRHPAAGDAPSVNFELNHSINGPVIITIDDRVLAKADTAGGGIRFTGTIALQVAREFAQGKVLSITQGGTVIAQPSLSGASAALRYMDAQQDRAGGVTALVARGRRPSSAIKPAPAMPLISAPSVPISSESEAMEFTLEEIKRAAQLSNCTSRYDDLEGPEGEESEEGPTSQSVTLYPLDAERKLLLLDCDAYSWFTVNAVLIVSGKPGSLLFSPAVFDDVDESANALYAEDGPAKNGVRAVTNANWNSQDSTLSSYSSVRNLRDCGSERAYLWDGSRFRLIKAASMPRCRGTYRTIQTWVASRILCPLGETRC